MPLLGGLGRVILRLAGLASSKPSGLNCAPASNPPLSGRPLIEESGVSVMEWGLSSACAGTVRLRVAPDAAEAGTAAPAGALTRAGRSGVVPGARGPGGGGARARVGGEGRARRGGRRGGGGDWAAGGADHGACRL